MSTMKPLCLVFAMSDDRVIGKGNALPWRIPEDLRHFKNVTMGHAVISGRKTYDSVGKPLPGRRNIIITRDASLKREGAEVVTTLQSALDLAYQTDPEPIILGGSEIFAITLPMATKMIVTFVHRPVDGDAHFPPIDWSQWSESWRRKAEAEPDVEFAEFTRL
jgi:dihydrofolate reductase